MLKIHILNVGHGDSCILEFISGDQTHYGVVDSNHSGGGTPRVLERLRKLGAPRLSFVCLTHPHKDHYSGLYSVLTEYKGKIDYFYTCPLGDVISNPKRLKTLALKYNEVRRNQDNPDIARGIKEFLQILKFAYEEFGPDRWFECTGPSSELGAPGFKEASLKIMQPPRRVKGYYVQQIEDPGRIIVENVHDNDLSIALFISYGGARILLGGDATSENWRFHQRWQEAGKVWMKADVVKLPHHGSKYDCDDDSLKGMFELSSDPERGAIALVSANGRTHPDPEVMRWIRKHGVQPYCTNLIPQCGANVSQLIQVGGIDPLLARWVREVGESSALVQSCQGDITVSIDEIGAIGVVTEHPHPCAFRGDYDRFFGA